jgi:hypothetical protein
MKQIICLLLLCIDRWKMIQAVLRTHDVYSKRKGSQSQIPLVVRRERIDQ